MSTLNYDTLLKRREGITRDLPEGDNEDEEESVTELKSHARKAMRALEKNNSVVAYNLLKRIVGD